MYNINNLFKQRFIPSMPIHACMQQNSPNCHQISHLTRAQQTKTRETTNNMLSPPKQPPKIPTCAQKPQD